MTAPSAGGGAPAEADGAGLKACPRCGRLCPAQETRCRRCLSDLRAVAALAPPEAAARLAFQRADARRASRAARRRRWLLAAAAVIAIGFGGAWFARDTTPAPLAPTTTRDEPHAAGATWSRAHGGAGATRATTARLPGTADVRWRYASEAPVVGLSADGERVYVARTDGRLVALEASTGEERWQLPVPGQLDEPPAIAGDRLYIGQRDGRVLALDAATGRVEWSRSPTQPFFIRSAPLVADGLAWAVSEHSLVAYDAESGAVLAESRFDDGANPVGAVAAVDHVAFSTGREQRIHDRRNGARSFSYALTGVQFIAAEGSVTVALGGSRLLAVHEDARAHWWERFRRQWSIVSFVGLGPMVPPPPREWMSVAPAEPLAPALGDGRVFVADTGGTVRAYELAGGAPTWERTDLGARGAPVLTPDGLVVPVADALLVLDPATGNERTRLPLAEPPHSVIVTDGGTYVAAGTGPAPTAVIALGR